jgi:hypothetical protein
VTFTTRVEPLGFHRTLKMFWTRRHPITVDFTHFHRHGSTYGAPRTGSVDIRVHFGIRVLNDDFIAPGRTAMQSGSAEVTPGNDLSGSDKLAAPRSTALRQRHGACEGRAALFCPSCPARRRFAASL